MAHILLTRSNTLYGKLIESITNTYWSHTSLYHNGLLYELNADFKGPVTLEESLEREIITDYVILPNSVSRIAANSIINQFNISDYENIQGLAKLAFKSKWGRDFDDIQTSPHRYTCASLIGREVQPNINCHWTQTIPQDFYDNIYK